ncbi:MAG: 4-hydroxybenzoate octaprenyltransferase [Alphaproteobacteria bacterium]|nr:4-hydroxybenzoate octaprenyltransferase [Alphaproteobacteria bacterium]MBV8548496.1 4-hydroxybenzoate octaprenyltransferase [Alphaproteobacteria bacterium]
MNIFTDINPAAWIDRNMPDSWRPYARLMRLDRPIGTWLLLLPCWWSLALVEGAPWLSGLFYALLFAIGALIMRGAGCVVNDIYDRNIDKMVERTSIRPLASGEVTLWQALVFLAVLLLIGLGILFCFNKTTLYTAIISLALVFTYPLMKRITWWPQLFLGFTFNWGALLGWAALTGSIGMATIPLYLGGVVWTLAYDTLYAHQDKRDDLAVGVKSTALLFGDKSRPIIALFYIAALGFFALAGLAAQMHGLFYKGLVIAGLQAAWHLALWRMDDPADCLKRFKASRDFGLIILAAILLGHWPV